MSSTTIALLPFDNLSGDPEQDYFARGFVEDIGTELSRFPTLEVLYPRATAALLADDSSSADGLAADHLLRGSTRRAGDVIRVAVQLIEFETERQVWANRYEATADTLLSVQDEIAARVAGALAIQVDEVRLCQARRKPLASLELYECWLRGLECLHRGCVEGDAEARRFFERALEIDPNYARAYTGLSLSHFNEWSCQAWQRWDETERLAYAYARRAAALDDSDAVAQVVMGRVQLFRREFDEAGHCIERAVALNANDADVLVHASLCLGLLGEGEYALSLARRAMRLNPRFSGWYLAAEAQALFVLGRYDESIRSAIKIPNALVDLPAWLAAAHALEGEIDQARTYVDRFLTTFTEKITFGREPEPGEPLRWLFHVNPFRRDEDAAPLGEGLRLAGLLSDPDERRSDAVPRTAPRETATFRRDGDRWTLAFDGQAVSLTDVKGFGDLAALLARPNEEVHCLELAGRPAEPGGRDAVLDDRAKREYRARMQDLQREIDEADAAHDVARAANAREELDAFVDMLSGSLGLHGRSRTLGSAAERARSAVTWRMRSAMKKIAAAHPRLGRHLENSVRTGTFSVYAPERPVAWLL
jgi:TolB-like protein/Tfp pilus assembly protein PilF